MIETIATVIGSSKGTLTLQASQKSSCDQCTQPDCGNGQVNEALSKKFHQITLPYSKSLEKGTQVILALPEQGLLTAASLMFVLPLLTLLSGAMVGEWVLHQSLQLHEGFVVISALLGGAAGYWGARRWHRSLLHKEMMEPQIMKVLEGAQHFDVVEVSGKK